MADSQPKPDDKRRKNKRKLTTSSEDNKPDSSKSPQTYNRKKKRPVQKNVDEDSENIQLESMELTQNDGVWDNLQLILSLQNKQLNSQRKMELAFSFVNSAKLDKGREEGFDQSRQTVSYPRLISFLIEWIQSQLITNVNSDEKAFLDFRCWEVFKFCIEECMSLGIPLSFSPNLLRSLTCVVRNILFALNDKNTQLITVVEYEYYNVVCDCVVLLFSHRGRLFNANVDLWVSLVIGVVDLVQKVYAVKVAEEGMGAVLLRLSCLLLEPFVDFVRVHPTPKNVFPVFVEKLLEPFLGLLEELYLQNDSMWCRKILKTVEEIVTNGLFHPAHVDGFLSTTCVEESNESNTEKVKKNSRVIVKSYHRHLFQKIEKIMSEKGVLLCGIGRLFELFVFSVKKQKGLFVNKVNVGTAIKSEHDEEVSENTLSENRLDAETSKSLFGLFVYFLEPLMLNLKNHSQNALEDKQTLLDTLSSFKSVNKMLASFLHEKIFARTEDDSEGTHLKFLKDSFEIVISFASKIYPVWSSSMKTDHKLIDVLPSLAKEIIDSLGYFMEIEYEIIENDLVILWLIIFIYSEFDRPVKNTSNKCILTSQMLHLGSQLITIYSELRQVHKPIFALCKAIRLFGSCDKDINYSRFMPCKFSISFQTRVQSVTMLICSQDIRLAISHAIESIPEGQLSGCIRQLKVDISESLKWLKVGTDTKESNVGPCLKCCSMSTLSYQAEFFGKYLSEIYTIILDCSSITSGNCVLVGNSIKDLITVVKPDLCCLIGKQGDSINEFLFSVIGSKDALQKMSECKNTMPILDPSSVWIFLFFFRIYLSCRSLIKQSISLMPPDLSRKTLEAIGDLSSAYCRNDWVNEIDWSANGYFSWIIEPSNSLLFIIQSLTDTCLREETSDCAQLFYVLYAMALQRLVDLNRQIKAFDFLLEKVVRLAGMKLIKGAYSRACRSEQELRISLLRQEATDITTFLTRYLKVIRNNVQSIFYNNSEEEEVQSSENAWDLVVCSLTEKSLPTAIWWILCRNIDVWCPHATKKKLRKFVSCLVQSYSSFISSSIDAGNHKMNGISNSKVVTMRQISLALLRDTVFDEESFLRRHLSSRICHALEKSVLPLFDEDNSLLRCSDWKSIPNWRELLSELDETSVVLNKRNAANSRKGRSSFSSKVPVESTKQLAVCQNLLNLLSWLPKCHINTENFSVCAAYILNLERLVILNLLHQSGELCMQQQNDLFRLLLCSRRTLKCLVMTYCEEKIESGQSLLVPVLCESSFSILWLSKSVSVAVELLNAFPQEHVGQVKHLVFSLMDHTSYLFLTLTKIHYRIAISSLLNSQVPKTGLPPTEPDNKVSFSDHDTSIQTVEACDVWEVSVLMAESLKEQTHNILSSVKTKLPSAEFGDCNRLSSIISCVQGFLWGLASVLNNIDSSSSVEKKPYKWKIPHKLFICMDDFEDFVHFCLHAVISKKHQQSDAHTKCSETNSVGSSKTRKKVLQMADIDIAIDSLINFDSFGRQQLKAHVLQSLLTGENPELAYLIRELLIASSAILKLKMKTGHLSKFGRSNSSSSSMQIFIWTSQFLLSEFGEMVKEPRSFSFVWLDGVIKYTEVLGSYISLIDSPSSRNAYAILIDIHLRVIARCILLQGKGATLASHESGSSTKTLGPHSGSSEWSLNEFKGRLRMSFKSLIQKTHLMTAMKSLEKALISEITGGVLDGGIVSSRSAAGVDCFDMLLESISGQKRLDDVKHYTETLVGTIFNIVLHLQGPRIFYQTPITVKIDPDTDPDSGAVTLMCIEVLIRVSGKPSLFQMHSSHIGQAFHAPAAIFQNFLTLRSSNPSTTAKPCSYVVDQQFSVDMFAACCQLLCTVLRHRKSESERSIGILQNSVSVLLHCLETVDPKDRGCSFSWQLREGVKSASFLRRIYEEIRHQKETLSSYSSRFLSNYISIYSGKGPRKTGIRREIDEALRPGVYALMDACSPEDLQQLHTVFGEGSCRRSLADLLHDYKQNFQYEGKV
ncbi:hypothetical protein ACHQM5_023555 [Ranunculus cassubicifolius]